MPQKNLDGQLMFTVVIYRQGYLQLSYGFETLELGSECKSFSFEVISYLFIVS